MAAAQPLASLPLLYKVGREGCPTPSFPSYLPCPWPATLVQDSFKHSCNSRWSLNLFSWRLLHEHWWGASSQSRYVNVHIHRWNSVYWTRMDALLTTYFLCACLWALLGCVCCFLTNIFDFQVVKQLHFIQLHHYYPSVPQSLHSTVTVLQCVSFINTETIIPTFQSFRTVIPMNLCPSQGLEEWGRLETGFGLLFLHSSSKILC